MGDLGSVGQIYMFVLLMLLFIGSGFALWNFINFIMEKKSQNSVSKTTSNQEIGLDILSKENDLKKLECQNNEFLNKNKVIRKNIGGFNMNNNGWLKLAVFSLVGILVSFIILGLVSTSNSSTTGYQQGNINNMQDGTNSNTMTKMQNNSNGNTGIQNNSNAMQQQLNQIQQQLNQLQQQLNGGTSNSSTQMQQGGSNSAGMGMNNMQQNSNMNNMQQNGNMPSNNSNMNNMQQNGNSNSNGNGSSGSGGSSAGMSMM